MVIYEISHQQNFGKIWKNFREIDLLNESTIKQLYKNCNFRKLRLKLRSPGLNMLSFIHVRDSESVEIPAMFAEV